ncbi:MAG: hypothetical protein RIS47_83 [Bacteroidota bacterium]|jgi:DNA-binding NtrC family response regulator
MEGKILAIDDNTDILFALKLLLKPYCETIVTDNKPENIPALLAKESFDLILLDMNFTRDANSGEEGFYWLERILEIDPSVVVVFITAYSDIDNTVRAIKSGATDFVQKPWVNEKLVATVNAGVMLRKSRLEVDTLKVKQKALHEIIDEPFHDFIGNSAEMKKVFANIAKVAATDASVLILGENGTGKELVARALHRSSLRRDENFVSIDLGALTESLFESELFGHERGAFTDAKSQRVGRFELAHKGSIFLDEIGNLSFAQQAKLLTVLERREVTKVGANKAASIDIRLICATNMPLVEMVAEEKFREDLLYRINTVEIHLPALRDRGEDAILLAKHFLKIYTKKYAKTVKDLSASAQKLLLSYHWPGNVRELQHAIERAIIMTDSTMLQPEDFIFSQKTKRTDEVALESYNLDEVEKSIIQKVMKKYAGNVSQAAKELGLTRTSLYRRMEKHGL